MNRILAFPKTGISYNDCFYRALEHRGVEVVEGMFTGGWLRQNVRRNDWLHMHWPSFEYRSPKRIQSLIRFARFALLLLYAHLLGARLIWTAHNLLPHDRCPLLFIDTMACRWVILLASLILVHGPGPAQILAKKFPGSVGKMVEIPHGHWIGYYPINLDQGQARQLLGLTAEDFVFLFVGLCKPYKNLHELIRVFRSLDLPARLLVAGKFQDRAYRDHIFALAADDSRIRIDEGFIADEDLQRYLLASNFVVAPYREILTSGTAMLALSFGRPLISLDVGFLRDVVPQSAGILFDSEDPQGLAKALVQAAGTHFDEQGILDHARQFSYDDAARIVIQAAERLESAKRP
jgi:glycosyltransferase involved in cell wall biosynthesis